eukprot:146504-Rhodomonas_salina.2
MEARRQARWAGQGWGKSRDLGNLAGPLGLLCQRQALGIFAICARQNCWSGLVAVLGNKPGHCRHAFHSLR